MARGAALATTVRALAASASLRDGIGVSLQICLVRNKNVVIDTGDANLSVIISERAAYRAGACGANAVTR